LDVLSQELVCFVAQHQVHAKLSSGHAYKEFSGIYNGQFIEVNFTKHHHRGALAFEAVDGFYSQVAIGPLEEWQKVAINVQGQALPCGHCIAEESPELLLKHVQDFLARSH
jgi:hypothetical protein